MKFSDPDVDQIMADFSGNLDSRTLAEISALIQPLTRFQRLLLFCQAKKNDLSDIFTSTVLEEESTLYDRTIDIFRGNFSETEFLVEHFEQELELVEVGLYIELFDLEDFRAILRHLYVKMGDFQETLLQINRVILRYLDNRKEKGSTGLSSFTNLLYYLGIPVARLEDLEGDLRAVFPKESTLIEKLMDLPISSAQRHPDHITDLAQYFDFENDLPILLQWLDRETLSTLEKAKRENILQNWDPGEINTMENLVKALRSVLPPDIPIAFETVVKPFTHLLSPRTLRPDDIGSNIPPELLQSYAEKLAFPIPRQKSDKTRIIFLGGAHIGSMAILISTGVSNILIDFGMSVANYSIPSWHPTLNHLDAVFLTHAHLDHSGAMPYLFGLGYSHPVFGSALTKALTQLLLLDSQRLMQNNINAATRDADHRFHYLSQSSWIHKFLDSYVPLRPNQPYQITPDITVTPIPSYHIQGSMGFFVEAGESSVYYTGDMNLKPSALFKEQTPHLPINADLTIVDATYFGRENFDYSKRDSILFKTVKEYQRVIIPAFSVGRAQEVMITLDQAGLTKERKLSMLGMATRVARLTSLKTNGFLDNHLTAPFEDEVIITGGGMLGGGIARELVEQTKDDPNTAIVLNGYMAQNTLGYRLLHGMEPNYKQKVAFARFSGHSSSKSLEQYMNSISGMKALVHVGQLSKDPFTSATVRESLRSAHSDYYIPTVGSVLEL